MRQTRTLSVDKAGKFYINDVPKTLPQLKADLAALARHNPPVTILVKADEVNNYGKVTHTCWTRSFRFLR